MTQKKKIFGSLDPFMEYGDVLGRKVANTTFLRALLSRDPFDEYHFYLPGKQQCRQFLDQVAGTFSGQAGRIQAWDRSALPAGLAKHEYHAFHLSDCIASMPQLARLRNAYSPVHFPITGVTHSLSYSSYGASFLAHLAPTTTARDSIVCTSRTGREVVRRCFASLRQGYGLSEATHPGPALRRIPLAVDDDALRPADGAEKSAARSRLGVDQDTTLLLVFGRLSHYSKMDLLPLLRALDRAKGLGMDPERFTLALAGWVEDGENYHQAVVDMAASMGLDVRVFARPDEARKQDLFHAADIFLSIADNPQETFGITIIEAMAAGLPVVASRYDGYRDLVRCEGGGGEPTGILVETLAPDRTDDIDALAPLLFDSDSHLLLAQQTVVDVADLAQAITRLHQSPQLRSSLGTAGRARVEARYAWGQVIEEYVQLWDELWTHSVVPVSQPHPAEMRYGHLFGHYADNADGNLRLTMSAFGEQVYRGAALPVMYPGVADRVDLDRVKKMLFSARKPVTMSDLMERVTGLGEHSLDAARFLVLWALKHDLLERAS